jgi:hypothetical protein
MRSRNARRASLLVAVAAAVGVPAVAAASPPQHATVPISFAITDTSLCGFPIAESATGEIDQTIFDDGSQTWHVHRYSAFSANGKTLTSNANFTRFIDPSKPQLVDDSGTIFSVQIPGQGVVFVQAGKLLLDQATGQVILDAGRAQFVEHDTDAFCTYLSS